MLDVDDHRDHHPAKLTLFSPTPRGALRIPPLANRLRYSAPETTTVPRVCDTVLDVLTFSFDGGVHEWTLMVVVVAVVPSVLASDAPSFPLRQPFPDVLLHHIRLSHSL